jgi:hypothetical protein
MSMRITLLSCAVLALTTTAAAAQTTRVGAWQPRPTIGVGLGSLGSLFCTQRPKIVGSSNAAALLRQEAVECFKPVRSVTVEIPLSVDARIRIEGSRTTMPIVPRGEWEASNQKDTAHIGRLMISAVVVRQPDELLSPYVGFGVALQRTRFDVAPQSRTGAVFHLHFGADLRPLDRLTVGAELGLSGTRKDPWFQDSQLTGEMVIRLKVGL